MSLYSYLLAVTLAIMMYPYPHAGGVGADLNAGVDVNLDPEKGGIGAAANVDASVDLGLVKVDVCVGIAIGKERDDCLKKAKEGRDGDEGSTSTESPTEGTTEPPTEATTEPPTSPKVDGPDLCEDSRMDTIVRTQDGSTYVFKGDVYYKIVNYAVESGYPKKIAADWEGLPDNLDASMTTSEGYSFFFKDGNCWRFTNKMMDSGYPKKISEEFQGIPDVKLDSAFCFDLHGYNLFYFFKDDEFYRYEKASNPHVASDYPSKIAKEWFGLPVNDIDAVFKSEDEQFNFFAGCDYYLYDDIEYQVKYEAPQYPRRTAPKWFSCPETCCI